MHQPEPEPEHEHEHEPIKLCIIDDIKSVVEGLTAIDWSAFGIEVAGVSYNGEEGLALIEREKPDIVITDIRMPRMDGLAMLEAVLGLKASCRVILVSGYTDFEYAKQAVRLGAFDFVVKPFAEEDIAGAVLKAKEQALEERSKLLGAKEMERKVRESLPLLRQEYFLLLVRFSTPWEQAKRRWEFLQVDLEPRGFVVMLLQIDGFEERVARRPVQEVELIRFSLQNIAEETIREFARCIVFPAKHNRFVAVLNEPSSSSPTRIAERICKNVERYADFTVSIGVGGRVDDVGELPRSLRQADRALAYHLYTEGNGAIGYDELPPSDSQAPLGLEQKDELLLALRSGNGERAAGIVSEMTAAFQRLPAQPHPDYLLSLYEELAASAIRKLYELVPQPEVQPLVDRFKAGRSESGASLTGLEQQLLALCRDGADLIRKNSLSEGQAIIYKALDYVKTHLGRNVAVTECAAHVHLSSSYFASLFKRVTGMTFTQYVTAERIQKAKALILGGMSVQEVAGAVGYEERRYFSEMFKKATGLTPSEFRESYVPGGDNEPKA